MISIAIDGSDEETFRRSIETMLRRGEADRAAARLRALLAPHVGDGKALPLDFLRISADRLSVQGWTALAENLDQHDRLDHPISALSVFLREPYGPVPATERTRRFFETTYYTDESFPFSQSTRDDLLDGYTTYGCAWSGDGETSDRALHVAGMDDLLDVLAKLEARLQDSEDPGADEIRAGSLGACLLAVLAFQALRDTIASKGMPRPLCVMAGCNGLYPYFDAPVAGIEQSAKGRVTSLDEVEYEGEREGAGSETRYASLLMSSIPRAKKRAVLVLEETSDEMSVRIANLRGLPSEEERPTGSNVMASLAALTSRFPMESDAPLAAEVPAQPQHVELPAKQEAMQRPDAIPELLPQPPSELQSPARLEQHASTPAEPRAELAEQLAAVNPQGLLRAKPVLPSVPASRPVTPLEPVPGFDLVDFHRAQPLARPEIRPVARPEVRPDVRVELHPAARPDTLPHANPEVRPHIRPAVQMEGRPELPPLPISTLAFETPEPSAAPLTRRVVLNEVPRHELRNVEQEERPAGPGPADFAAPSAEPALPKRETEPVEFSWPLDMAWQDDPAPDAETSALEAAPACENTRPAATGARWSWLLQVPGQFRAAIRSLRRQAKPTGRR